VHKGHLGITDQGFEAKNLPPQLQDMISHVDEKLRSRGMDGISKNEVQFLLQTASKLDKMSPPALAPASAPSQQQVPRCASLDMSSQGVDVIELKKLKAANQDLRRQLSQRDAEIQALKEQSSGPAIGGRSEPVEDSPEYRDMALELQNAKAQISRLEVDKSNLEVQVANGLHQQTKGQAPGINEKIETKLREMKAHLQRQLAIKETLEKMVNDIKAKQKETERELASLRRQAARKETELQFQVSSATEEAEKLRQTLASVKALVVNFEKNRSVEPLVSGLKSLLAMQTQPELPPPSADPDFSNASDLQNMIDYLDCLAETIIERRAHT